MRPADISLSLPAPVATPLAAAAQAKGVTLERYVLEMLERAAAAPMQTRHGERRRSVEKIAELVKTLPGVEPSVGVSEQNDLFWWVKFSIDITHPLAWHVVQWLGWVVNDFAADAKFAARIGPVSPPPYLNGGPAEYLSWVIESEVPFGEPRPLFEALKKALPEDEAEWTAYDEDGEEDDGEEEEE